MLATAYLIFAPAAVGERDDRIRARELLRAGGGDSFSFMSTWPGSSYWFSPDGTVAIAYQLHHNVAVTVGGPFGPAFADVRVFKRKFQPDFSPVWLVVADSAALPATDLALVRCCLPQLTLRQAARMAATLGRDRARS